jgi:hypothetical protein
MHKVHTPEAEEINVLVVAAHMRHLGGNAVCQDMLHMAAVAVSTSLKQKHVI